MRVGRRQDEREADHLRPEEGERGHPVARLPEVLDERELPVRVRADQAAVHLEVLRRRGEVLRGERVVLLAEEGERLDVAGPVAVGVERTAHEVDLVDGALRIPPRRPVPVARGPVSLETSCHPAGTFTAIRKLTSASPKDGSQNVLPAR